MGDDQELCLRSWLNGLLVGWYNCPFKSLSAGGMRIGMVLFANEQSLKNAKKNISNVCFEKKIKFTIWLVMRINEFMEIGLKV